MIPAFDPDLDPDDSRARILSDIVSDGLGALGAAIANEHAQPRGAAHA